jgi:hypothetical protein
VAKRQIFRWNAIHPRLLFFKSGFTNYRCNE